MPQSPDRATAILTRFTAAQISLVTRLRDLPAALAEQAPGAGVWSAAQIGWHVAVTNTWVANVLLGSTPTAQPAPAGFKERFDASALPVRIKTIPAFEPPAFVRRDAALEKLRASGQQVTKAIASLTPERGAGYTVALQYGTMSLFEFADFAAGHVARHVAQVERAVSGSVV
jgi:uncharacterized damage-inducible protein DinB